MGMMTVYHGGYQVVDKPEIRKGRNTKDFGTGFYCTIIKVANKQTKKRLIHSNLETGYFLGFDAECRIIVFVRVDTNHNGFTVIHS